MFSLFTHKLHFMNYMYHMAFIEERSIKLCVPLSMFLPFYNSCENSLFQHVVCMRNAFWRSLRRYFSLTNSPTSVVPYGYVNLTIQKASWKFWRDYNKCKSCQNAHF